MVDKIASYGYSFTNLQTITCGLKPNRFYDNRHLGNPHPSIMNYRSQWIRRYFVLSLTPSGPLLEEYHCDKKESPRKIYDLTKCEQVDSYLQMADMSCVYPRISMMPQWIFSLHLEGDKNTRKREIIFVAQSETEMNAWVVEMCRLCGLTRTVEDLGESPTIRFPPEGGQEVLSSLPISSSERSSESLIDHTPSDLTSEGHIAHGSTLPKRNNRYQSSNRTSKMQNGTHPRMSGAEKKISIRQRNASGEHLQRASSSASACSSMASAHHTEDETTSLHSSHSVGPPLPPKPVRHRITQQSSSTSSVYYSKGPRGLDHPVPAPACTLVEVENESSGETIKINHSMRSTPVSNYVCPHSFLVIPSVNGSKASSVCSSMAIGPTRQGPPVDRSKKPAKLRLDQDDMIEENSRSTLTRQGKVLTSPRTPQQKRPTGRQHDPPRSAGAVSRTSHLEYFEPNFKKLERAVSVRSTNHSDFDYIKIDAAKTQAMKEIKRDRT